MKKETCLQRHFTEKKRLHVCDCEILSVGEVADRVYTIQFFAPDIAHSAQPGQFLQIQVSDSYDPLLRRPFSLHRLQRQEGKIEILFKVVGRGTEILANKKVGMELDVMGPLGKGFAVEGVSDNFLLLAGGMGIAPLFFAAEELLHRGKKVIFFAGFKDRGQVCCVEDLQTLGAELFTATEDGSVGFCGTVMELFKDYWEKQTADKESMILACGPRAMLKDLADKWDVTCQVSLEERMACGLGACMGCPIKIKHPNDGNPYRLICVDGPVFYLKEILLDG